MITHTNFHTKKQIKNKLIKKTAFMYVHNDVNCFCKA